MSNAVFIMKPSFVYETDQCSNYAVGKRSGNSSFRSLPFTTTLGLHSGNNSFRSLSFSSHFDWGFWCVWV